MALPKTSVAKFWISLRVTGAAARLARSGFASHSVAAPVTAVAVMHEDMVPKTTTRGERILTNFILEKSEVW